MTDVDVYAAGTVDPAAISDAKFGIIAIHDPRLPPPSTPVAYVRVTKNDERHWRELRRLHPDLVRTWDRPADPAEFKMLVGRTYRIRPPSCPERHTYHVGPNVVIRAQCDACLAAFRKNVKADPNLWTETNPLPGKSRRDLKIERDKLAAKKDKARDERAAGHIDDEETPPSPPKPSEEAENPPDDTPAPKKGSRLKRR